MKRLFLPSARLVMLALLVAPSACRNPPAASEDYAQAHARFSAIYARRLDDAFLDPDMDRVLAQLNRVPEESLDAAAAVKLRRRIEEGRLAARKRAAQRTEDRAALHAPASAGPGRSFDFPRASKPLVITPVVADAGVPAAAGPALGSAERDLANFRGCFASGPPVTVQGKGALPRYELVDRLSCRQEYPAFADQLLLIEQGKVAIISPKSAVRRLTPDAGN